MSVIDQFSLDGKRAFVTGSSRGLGKAMAIALAEAGADIVCASSTAGGADDTAKCVESLGRRAWTASADLADRKAVLRMAEDAQRQAGAIDILVNNGGTIARQPAVDYSEAEWDRVLNTDLDSVWFLSQYFGRGMVERRSGKIINIASVLSFSGGVTVPAYTASKHAVAGLTKALANEWARHDVQVNAIAPGYFSTDNTQRSATMRRASPKSRREFPPGAGVTRTSSPARWCFWRRRPATTSMATSCLSTAAGWRGKHTISMQLLPDSIRARSLSTQELRDAFLVQGLFKPDTVTLRHVDLDRVVLGGAVPCCDTLSLAAPASLAAEYFLERRELGVLNIGAPGSVTVDGQRYALNKLDVLYVGRGSRDVRFESDSVDQSAKFYLDQLPGTRAHARRLSSAPRRSPAARSEARSVQTRGGSRSTSTPTARKARSS